MSWAEEEFKTLNLDDAKLNARAMLLAERLSQKSIERILSTCHGWAETQQMSWLDSESALCS